MNDETEIPFAIFLKSCYEVRPKKHPVPNVRTHHWKLRIEPINSNECIKRVEFHLHNTFPKPIQVKPIAPFEIEEDGFGNFQMLIYVKIMNRKIAITYDIILTVDRSQNIQYHYSLWNVKISDVKKMLEIGAIPMDQCVSEKKQLRILNKISAFLGERGDSNVDWTAFNPGAFEKVLGNKLSRVPLRGLHCAQKRLIEGGPSTGALSSQRAPSQESAQTQVDYRHKSTAKSSHKQAANEAATSMKEQLFGKSPSLSKHSGSGSHRRHRLPDESDSDRDSLAGANGLSHKKMKRSDGSSVPVKKEPKLESSVKPDKKLSSSKPVESKQRSIIEKVGGHQKQDKLHPSSKVKIKTKESTNNPDVFSTIFDAPDTIVVNRGKANLAKDKCDNGSGGGSSKKSLVQKPGKKLHKSAVVKEEAVVREADKKLTLKAEPVLSSHNTSGKLPDKKMPEGKGNNSKLLMEKACAEMHNKLFNNTDSEDDDFQATQVPDKPEAKNSDFSNSSSDNEIDYDLFKPKKSVAIKATSESPLDPRKLGVKQLFGETEASDEDDDDDEEITGRDTEFAPIVLKKEPVNVDRNASTQHKSYGEDNHSKKRPHHNHQKELQPQDRVHYSRQPRQQQLSNSSRSSSENDEHHRGSHRDYHEDDRRNHNRHRSDSDDGSEHNNTLVDIADIRHKSRKSGSITSTPVAKGRSVTGAPHHDYEDDSDGRDAEETKQEISLEALSRRLERINNKEFFLKLEKMLIVLHRQKERGIQIDSVEGLLSFDLELMSSQYTSVIKAMVDEYYDQLQQQHIAAAAAVSDPRD